MLVHKGGIVGEGSWAEGGSVPKGRLDDVGVDVGEQVVQDLGVHLEARLVERVCARMPCPAQPTADLFEPSDETRRLP